MSQRRDKADTKTEIPNLNKLLQGTQYKAKTDEDVHNWFRDLAATNLGINKRFVFRGQTDCPWKPEPAEWQEEWSCWQPAQFDRRMFAQHGAFLLGGCPISTPIADANNKKQVRGASSLYTEWHNSKFSFASQSLQRQ